MKVFLFDRCLNSLVLKLLWASLILTTFHPIAIGADSVVAARVSADVPVTVKADEKLFTLDNGIVTAAINKRTGDLESLIYKHVDTLGHDQGRASYWEQDPSAAAKVG